MQKRNGPIRVRIAVAHCKPSAGLTLSRSDAPRRRGSSNVDRRPAALLAVALAALPLCSACTASRTPRAITLAALENAPVALAQPQQITVADAAALRQICLALGPRLGLIQIRSAAEWARLARIAPQLGPCPDLRQGTVVGLACWAGTPVDGHWSVHIDTVRVCDGAGLVTADFAGGTFLPDGSAQLETAHVQGLAAVLAVDVDGTMFYPP